LRFKIILFQNKFGDVLAEISSHFDDQSIERKRRSKKVIGIYKYNLNSYWRNFAGYFLLFILEFGFDESNFV